MRSVEAHRGLVERLEQEARQSPGLYRLKLALLAALGFVVLGGSVLGAIAMSVGLVLVLLAINPILLLKLLKIVWIPIAFGWVILRSLWVRFQPPEGHLLRADEGRELRAEIEYLRAQTDAPPLEGIVITPELNAAAASVPRAMGLLGHRHYLVLGLPLMQLLDREQFSAVVAHEFGHFGGGHARFGGWIYRVRASWFRVLDALSMRRSWATRAFTRFFDWYAPYFNAYSFVLARANEYEADATAARVAGADPAAQALVRVNLAAEHLHREFWPSVQRSARADANPPVSLYGDMAAHLSKPGANEAETLAALLGRRPDLEDTHPTLAQRLEALEWDAHPVAPTGRSAADVLLRALQQRLEQQFSLQWREEVGEYWQERHGEYRRDSAELARLEKKQDRTDAEAVEYARLVEDLETGLDPIPLYHAALVQVPDSAMANFRLGALLLSRDDGSGAGYLRKAMDLDPEAEEAGLHHLHGYYQRSGNRASLAEINERLRALHARRVDAAHARGELTMRDRFLAHGLASEPLAQAVVVLAASGRVKRAWIARKYIPGEPGAPHFVVLVAWRGVVLNPSRALDEIVEALDLPGSFMVFTAEDRRIVAGKVKKACGRPVFER